MTEILHHLSTCHSTLSLGVRGCKLCISKSKVIEVVQDFFHPPKKEKDFLYVWSCKFLPVISYFQGIKPAHGSSHSSPSVLHFFTCTDKLITQTSFIFCPLILCSSSPRQLSTRQNELHGSRRTLHCKLHATLTLHTARNTTATLHYVSAALPTLPRRTEKLTCIFMSFLKSIKAPKCCPCQQFGSVAR